MIDYLRLGASWEQILVLCGLYSEWFDGRVAGKLRICGTQRNRSIGHRLLRHRWVLGDLFLWWSPSMLLLCRHRWFAVGDVWFGLWEFFWFSWSFFSCSLYRSRNDFILASMMSRNHDLLEKVNGSSTLRDRWWNGAIRVITRLLTGIEGRYFEG